MVYVFLADGFEEIEALTPVDLLRRVGVEVKTVGVTGAEVTGSHGITIKADITAECAESELASCELEMIVLPGGMPGSTNLDASPTVEKFIEAAEKSDAYIAAICAAPMILGKRGLLKGRDATCYPGFEEYLEGAKVYDAAVVVDGKYVTSNGMGSALDFALQLVELLKGQAESEKLADAVMA
ncbi:MAG: DJ-1/PfpI family protein [Ruminococcaceae bacterium]|nr:DJ-1/PfpI family protein [Oscillospiraceae bacterium]